MQLITITLTFIVIFTTFYSYGSLISNKFFKNNEIDIFFKILIGYSLIGIIALIIHFFFKINNSISIIIILISIIFFIYDFSSIKQKRIFYIINNYTISQFIATCLFRSRYRCKYVSPSLCFLSQN